MRKSEQYAGLFTFEKDAQLWDDLYERPTKLFHYHMALRRDHAVRYTTEHFAPEARVLDLGCGAGVVLEGLLDAGFTNLTGVDLSADMLELAERRLARFDPCTFTLREAGCFSLPFPDHTFDAVLCMGVFGYFDDVDAALREIRRVLKPGGTFLMSIRSLANKLLFDPWRGARWLLWRTWHALRLPTRSGRRLGDPAPFRIDIFDLPGRVIDGVEATGFELVGFDGLGFGPPSLNGKPLLSLPRSIALSDSLTALANRLRVGRAAARIADVSMYAFRKT